MERTKCYTPGAQYTCFNQGVSSTPVLTTGTKVLLKGKSTCQHANGRNLHPTRGKKSHSCPTFYGHYIFLPQGCGNYPKEKLGDRNSV